jgi:glucokinase
MSQLPTIGIDLGGTQVRAALVDHTGKILNRVAMPTPVQYGAHAIVTALHTAAKAVAVAGEFSSVGAIGVACPGPLNTRTGVALGVPTLPGFNNFPVGKIINEMFGRKVHLANDGIAAAVGEWRFGAARGLSDFVYITVSTGIGGGVIAGGQILHGRSGMGGHIGHVLIAKDGDVCNCGRRGCLEAYAAGPALERRAAERLRHGHVSSLPNLPTSSQIFDAAAQGDAVAQGLVDDQAAFLGAGIVNVLHAFDPECVVLGGGVSHRFDQLSAGIQKVIAQTAMPGFRDIPVRRAEHIGNSGLLGAAALALD